MINECHGYTQLQFRITILEATLYEKLNESSSEQHSFVRNGVVKDIALDISIETLRFLHQA
jgi:hypothetical protein